MTKKEALRLIGGSVGEPSKMPGTAYGISASKCKVGAKLALVEGSVCHGCYAFNGNYQYDSVKTAHERRLESISRPEWTGAMVEILNRYHGPKGPAFTKSGHPFAKGWHRWHDSGDLQSVEHLTKICAVAALTPTIKHWLPTREIGVLHAYVKAGGIVPDNLTIRVSATMVDGNATKTWPTTSGVHRHAEPPQGTNKCPAPDQDNHCGDCRACWSREVPHVSYHFHN